jgi:transposase
MSRHGRYPEELRERAVRMVLEHSREHDSEWAAITSIAAKGGGKYGDAWDLGPAGPGRRRQRPGLTSEERERLRQLERENKELRRANEILKSASAFFAAELGRKRPR